MSITDILAALGVLFDSLPQGLLAMAYGFAALPTAIGFGIGALICLFFQLPTPVSFQAETTILAGGLGNNTRERISIIIFAGIAMLILGITGALSGIIGFIGQDILNGMLAGVGIILVKASLDLLKSNLAAGITSFATAVPIFLFIHNLIYACVGSVILGAAAFHIMRYIQKKNGQELVDEKYQTDERIKFLKPIYNHRILRGALAVIMLQIGGNISYGTITANMAHAAVDVDKLSIVGGMATATSGLFGGTDLEILLKGLKKNTLIITGAATNVCVYATCLDAQQRDYRVVAVADCVAGTDRDLHKAFLRNIEYVLGDVATAEELQILFA